MAGCTKTYDMGTYGYDAELFAKQGIKTIELKSPDGMARVLLVPGWQGRVMTSTDGGTKGRSYGWINHKYIESGENDPQFNPFGGEERFWIGPEGGPFSWYFKQGVEQVYANWDVPKVIDTEEFDVESSSAEEAIFTKEFTLTNASGTEFRIGARRKVTLLDSKGIEEALGIALPEGVAAVAYKTENSLTNLGEQEWTKQTGMPSVWLLGMYNPSPTTTVFIPYNQAHDGRIVNDGYFGKVPSDRLIVEDGMISFKIDGKFRSKIGLPAGSAKDLCGSYDSKENVLNILKYSVPEGDVDYVNGQWGPQDDPFGGDVINSYNDGPTETGTIMGPFYEIETSSPGAALSPGGTLTHTQCTFHFEGSKEGLASIANAVFGTDLSQKHPY